MPKVIMVNIPRNLRGCSATPSAILVEKLLLAEPGDTVIVEAYEETYPRKLAEELLKASGFIITDTSEGAGGRYIIQAILP